MFRSITNELAVVSGNETINRRTNVRIDDQLCRPLDHFSYAFDCPAFEKFEHPLRLPDRELAVQHTDR